MPSRSRTKEKRQGTELEEYIKDIRRQIDKERRFEDLSRKKSGIWWTIKSYRVTNGERIPWHPFRRNNAHDERHKGNAITTAAWIAKEGRLINPNHKLKDYIGEHCQVDIHAQWNTEPEGSNNTCMLRQELVFQLDTRDDLFSQYWNEHSKS